MNSNKGLFYSIACFAAISLGLYVISLQRNRNRRKKRLFVLDCCHELNERPQCEFQVVLADNSPLTPFQHLKREGQQLDDTSILHPYENEINLLLDDPPFPFDFSVSNDRLGLHSTFTYIKTQAQLEVLAELLSKEKIFGVDTEQHSHHSFLGFTALIQISTFEEDYLVDTIALHDVMGILRPVFADSSICKVFHGAENDITWLQRDFHIYVVNLFDTAKACEALGKPQRSLVYLLETYCGVTSNKMLQRSDWRLRPLSEEMVQYARGDSHYLLYIASCLVGELQSKSMSSDDQCGSNASCVPSHRSSAFDKASRRSNMPCLQLYTKDVETSPGNSDASSILSRFMNKGKIINKRKYNIEHMVWLLCKWRDFMARLHDESLKTVLSDQAIWALAAKLPQTENEILYTVVHADSLLDTFDNLPSSPSLSPIFRGHVKDVSELLQEGHNSLDSVFVKILKRYSSTSGGSFLSAYNGYFPCDFSFKPSSRLVFQKNGGLKNKSRKSSRDLFVRKFSCKSPVYHNFRIYASDGRLICYCDRRKLQWYLSRGLAKQVECDPPAIMLLFEPKGRPEDEDNGFYIQSKKNMCVGCGERSHYVRYRLIPSCYRMHFPEHLKSHRSHDIVLLCVDCHEIAHAAAEKYKKRIAVEFGIPLVVETVHHLEDNQDEQVTDELHQKMKERGVSPLQLRAAAMALLRHGSTIPEKRREELLSVVRNYFGREEISDRDVQVAVLAGMTIQERRRFLKKRGVSSKDLLEENLSQYGLKTADSSDLGTGPVKTNGECMGADDNPSQEATEFDKSSDQDNNESQSETNRGKKSGKAQKDSLIGHGVHGRKVVESILREDGEDGLRKFCQRWRLVFVDAIHPRFLPSGWDIMHSGRREFGDFSVYNPDNKDIEFASSSSHNDHDLPCHTDVEPIPV